MTTRQLNKVRKRWQGLAGHNIEIKEKPEDYSPHETPLGAFLDPWETCPEWKLLSASEQYVRIQPADIDTEEYRVVPIDMAIHFFDVTDETPDEIAERELLSGLEIE